MTALSSDGLAEIDPDRFRTVLGHYPTGVVVITSLDKAGNPVGMVVGSFTSASLVPPLVAYFPSKDSSSYRQLRDVPHFVVNILAAEQAALCRQFAMKNATDKWAGVAWRKSARGLPILNDAVAWIECQASSTLDAGDHDIVLGRVLDLDALDDMLPLVFFQGGYGRFTPRSIVSATGNDLVPSLQLAERARPVLEKLGESLGLECGLQAAVGDELVLVAAYAPMNATHMPPQVGARIPFVPPSGSNCVAWAGPEEIASWLARSPTPLTDEGRQALLDGLQRVRERGYSLVLEHAVSAEVDHTARSLASRDLTPSRRRRLLGLLTSLVDACEPSSFDVIERSPIRLISVPGRATNGSVVFSLQARHLAAGQNEEVLARLAERLHAAAHEISQKIA